MSDNSSGQARLPNADSLSNLIDRLVQESIKMAKAEWGKAEERKKESPDPEVIAKLDLVSRTANESRALAKNKIEDCLEELNSGNYKSLREVRIF